jgi:sulfur carrier protein ThiS
LFEVCCNENQWSRFSQPPTTIHELLDLLGVSTRSCRGAKRRGGARSEWTTTELEADDDIDVVTAAAGG